MGGRTESRRGTNLTRPVDGGEDLRVAHFDVRGALGLRQHAGLCGDAAQLCGTAPVAAEPEQRHDIVVSALHSKGKA